jgi:hypothetical protein
LLVLWLCKVSCFFPSCGSCFPVNKFGIFIYMYI